MMTSFNTVRYRTAWITAVILAATAWGCAWPWPHLQHNSVVHRYYEDHQIYAQYQYYTAGSLDDPRGILALKPGYMLNSPEWTAVSMTPDMLGQWIAAMKQDPYVEENQFPNGANLIGRNNEVAGYYYSVWEYPIVRVSADKTLDIDFPRAQLRNTNRFYIEMFYDGGIGYIR